MQNEGEPVDVSTLDLKSILAELEVPFPAEQIQWRVTNTARDKKRGQIIPYADPRAYADRLNALFTPQGWTREYKVETMSNITRFKKSESIVSGKILVACTVTIIGLWSHSGTGEEWADDENAMTAADAQAFKRACACFGLGRYFYDFHGSWVDLDQNQQPKRIPPLPAWAISENWRRGMRPLGKNGNSNRPHDNGHSPLNGIDLDAQILSSQKVVGPDLYRSVLREYGKAEEPKLIRDAITKQRVLDILESATRGLRRLDTVTRRIDPKTLDSLLAKLQAPPLREIRDMRTLRNVVFGLEQFANSPQSQRT